MNPSTRSPASIGDHAGGDLERELHRRVDGEVRFDAGTRALYATDSSNYRQVPIGVVVPRTVDDVVATHDVCHRHGAPILNRGTGTSLSGETVNWAVVIDHSKHLTAIGEPDVERRLVSVQPGAINEQVNQRTGQVGLLFGPDPSTHSFCTIGGNIGNNSCGIHSVQSQFYGKGPRTSDNVQSLEVLTYDGVRMRVGETTDDEYERIVAAGGRRAQIYRDLQALRDRYADLIRDRFPDIPRRVSGYNLDELLPEKGFNVARALVGTESTCVTALEATLHLTPAMLERSLVVVAYDDIFSAGDHLMEVLEHRPIGLEAIDHLLFEDEQHKNMHPAALRQLPRGGGNAWLMVEFGADRKEEADERARSLIAMLKGQGLGDERVSLFRDPREEQLLWKVREGGLGATAFPPDGTDHWPGWEDSAVAPDKVGDYLRDLKRLYDKYGLRGALYGHLGQGCIHSRISFDLRSPDGLRDYRSFMEEAADLVVSYGGSLSGEHGDGQQRAELLDRMYGPELVDAFRRFKRIWDPDGKMNPGKVVDPFPLDENLKLGADYNPPRPVTKFAYRSDGFDFAHATVRCVGVGQCRQPEGADVMCPSFMVTREEKHTTRGRARLLFEMLQGDVITDGWRSREVHDALDLCLACKGCTSDCPVQVDMPTYKAEFLYHHWARRLRPRHAYALGFIDQAARLASLAPGLVNAALRSDRVARAVKWAGGVTPRRGVPAFAPMSLQRWFRDRGGTTNPGGPRVVLWPDTFNNYFHTAVGVACVEALESAGWQVDMPVGHVCCGRPLYDYGFLDVAGRYLRGVLDVLRDDIRAGTPVVGMEPSCLAVFKDELTKILPHDDDARRLAGNACHFSEFFGRFDIDPPRLERRALVWSHCHQKATGGAEPELRLLERMGLQVETVTGGCCGLAGSWGFENGHYDISMACGEQALLPAVRRADLDTLVVGDGFSCRTQVEHGGTGRRALHVAQVMRMAREHGPGGPPGPRPEDAYPDVGPAPRSGRLCGSASAGYGWDAPMRALTSAMRVAVRRPATRRRRR